MEDGRGRKSQKAIHHPPSVLCRLAKVLFIRYLLFGDFMRPKYLFSILVLALAMLNMGVIRRNEDPIRDTQTNPILYEQKKQEEKDGKKGALLYSVKYNPPSEFLVAPPVDTQGDKEVAQKAKETGTDITGWWEETPAEDWQNPSSLYDGPVVDKTSMGQDAAGAVTSEAQPMTASGPSLEDDANAASAAASPGDYWW